METVKVRMILYSFVIFAMGVSFFFGESKVSANAHPSIQLRDGNATWADGGYRPSKNAGGAKTWATDVSPSVKTAWEKGDIDRGGKFPKRLYSVDKGNRFFYDVYEGSTDHDFKQGWQITKSGGEDFFTFDGWAAIDGYYHHDVHNTATYIGVINKTDRSDRRVFKTRLTNLNAGKDLEWNKQSNTGSIRNKCPNTGQDSLKRNREECNMEYKWVGFRAYIPLAELFKQGNEVWEFYIIKAVKGMEGGTRLVYDELILPFEKGGVDWNDGQLTLTSGSDLRWMTMTNPKVIKRTKPRSAETGIGGVGYFDEGETYQWIHQSESAGTTVWHGLKVPNENPSTRYASSAYLQFGGNIATLSWKKTQVDVTVHHKDSRTATIVRTERLKAPYNSANNYTLRPKTKGNLIDQNGKEIKSRNFSYVADPSRTSQTITRNRITGNFTVTFTYQAYVDVVINHIDKGTGEVLATEQSIAQYNDPYTVNPKPRGHFKNTFGYPYVAVTDSVKFNNLRGTEEVLSDGRKLRKQTINIYYKPVLPDPSRVVEVGGGRNTHGHAEGQSFWELRKENVNEKSKLYAESNYTITGTHYATRNEKHTLNLDTRKESSTDPIALIAKASDFKNKNMEYDFEYEYTNHFDVSYFCSEKIGNDCVEWKRDKIVPAWQAPYGKKFKLSESEGGFSYYTTSRLGRIVNENVIIYNEPTDKTGVKAGDSYGYTYFIKEKAVRGNDVYYRLSNGASAEMFPEKAIGWVKENDLMTYTHFGMDRLKKVITLNGNGNSYTRAWGWTKQQVHDLSRYKGEEFHVNLTETVGDNIWYRGKINGTGSDIWVHQNHTNSIEVINVKPTSENLIKRGNQANILQLKMDHRHGETIKKENIVQILNERLLVGRSDSFTEATREKENYYERFEKLDNLMKPTYELKTQSALNVKPDSLRYFVHVPSGNHKKNGFTVLQKGNIHGHYYPVDVDESLKEDLKNSTERSDLGKYAFFLQQSEMRDRGIQGGDRVYDMDFVSDYFFVAKRTGFVTVFPYAYQLNRHFVHNDTKPTEKLAVQLTKDKMARDYFKHTSYDFKDEIIGINGEGLDNIEKLQRYYVPIDPASELKPNEVYTNHIFLKNIGLNDVNWEYGQKFSFEHYLFGSGHDDAWLIEQSESKISDFSERDVHSIVIKHTEKEGIVNSIKERPKQKLHQFRVADLDFFNKIREAIEGF
ncbi:hypothetical protein [Siminovitchia fortis]|uniref:hypothetical protein n=1 Tax=Siminovitchia fortis TaxID=254758 RepID=UPI0011A6AAA4|nr:hypothetical protein [Siminovitchia fortis]